MKYIRFYTLRKSSIHMNLFIWQSWNFLFLSLSNKHTQIYYTLQLCVCVCVHIQSEQTNHQQQQKKKNTHIGSTALWYWSNILRFTIVWNWNLIIFWISMKLYHDSGQKFGNKHWYFIFENWNEYFCFRLI